MLKVSHNLYVRTYMEKQQIPSLVHMYVSLSCSHFLLSLSPLLSSLSTLLVITVPQELHLHNYVYVCIIKVQLMHETAVRFLYFIDHVMLIT